jgi:hypothetical protein
MTAAADSSSEAVQVGLVKAEEATPHRALLTKELLRQEAQQRALVAQYVREQMKEGVDFGVIPGTAKPTLLKPGAEKLVDLFRCTPTFTVVEKVQDWDRGFFNYMFKCSIRQRDSSAVLAVGFGSANSYESRYRWREGKRKCPGCGSDALLMSKDKPEWFCWRKRGGCGAIFQKTDERITSQQVGRVENPDLPDMANTILKMGKKRALVDAAIALARCSDMFTQDVEDFAPHEAPPEVPAPQPARAAPAAVEVVEEPAAPARPAPAARADVLTMTDRLLELEAERLEGALRARPNARNAPQVMARLAEVQEELTKRRTHRQPGAEG